jgi:rubrerythrin
MATVKQLRRSHDTTASTWECSECGDEFEFAGVPDFCPCCGVEIDSTSENENDTAA